MAPALEKVEDKLNDHVVIIAENRGYGVGNPSMPEWPGQQLFPRAEFDLELGAWSLLFHHLHINLLHVNLLVEFWREFGALEELGVDSGRHDCGRRLSRAGCEVDCG